MIMAKMMQMMAKAQKFKTKMQELQERVGKTEVGGTAGNGLVTCVVTGKFDVKKIKVDPSLIKAEEADVMEDLIVAALNDARAKAEKLMSDESQKLMSELGLPPGLDLPF
jgi:DNA-binding YbaB/EbfC family protein